jgi:hypothetical protein
MGETRVDLLHLLEDLRDAYPGSLEETIVTEAVANSLDSGASLILLATDPAAATLKVVDDGAGMKRRELARYHDIAASTKSRGAGIGFAGVGIKLGLLVSEDVLTETRRPKSHVATVWRLTSRHRAPWKWVPPPGDVAERGTAVRFRLANPLSPLLDPGFLENTLRRHFPALLDPAFDEVITRHYPAGVLFEVNQQRLERGFDGDPRVPEPLAVAHSPSTPGGAGPTERGRLEIRLARRRKPSAIGYLTRHVEPLPEDHQGLAISTFGKVIKRGWDWLGITPVIPARVGGLIEAPELAACLTLNKGDFIRVGTKGAMYLAYRKAIQEAVSRQLVLWGDAPGAGAEPPPKTPRLERDLERVLEDLSDTFPLLASLVERRRGGQKRLPIAAGIDGGGTRVAAVAGDVARGHAPEQVTPDEGRDAIGEPVPPVPGSASEAAPAMLDAIRTGEAEGAGRRQARKPTRYGLTIRFESRADDVELARLVESTVWINQSHPAYRRALASRSIGYHICLAVALALAPLAVEPADEHAFVTAFLARWGESLDTGGGRARGSRRRR